METEPRLLRLKALLAAIVSLIVVGYCDSVTSYELHFFPFYFIPVAICAWYRGRFWVVTMALMCALVWGNADQLAGHHYPNGLYIVWNCLIQFAGSAVLGLLVQQLKATLKEAQSEKEKLAKALEELERSTEKIKKLQSQIQVVCAWTNRVKVDGEWMPMDQFLESELGMKVSHGMSSEAVDKFKREIEESMEDNGVPAPPHPDIAPEKEK